jgi:hypothetical protein
MRAALKCLVGFFQWLCARLGARQGSEGAETALRSLPAQNLSRASIITRWCHLAIGGNLLLVLLVNLAGIASIR